MTKTFPPWRKQLAALSGFAAVAVLFNALYGPYNGAVSGILWDYAIDPVVLAVAVVFVAASVRDSLRDRQQPGSHLAQIPQDVVTALIAVFWVRYLIQYNDQDGARRRGYRLPLGAPRRDRGRRPRPAGDHPLAVSQPPHSRQPRRHIAGRLTRTVLLRRPGSRRISEQLPGGGRC